MKKPQIAILHSTDNLAGLETVLARLGFEGQFSPGVSTLRAAMQRSVPDLLLVDSELADKNLAPEDRETAFEEFSNLCPLLFVEKDKESFLFSDLQRSQALSLFDFNNYVLEHINNYSRKCLRLEVNLPSLLTRGDSSQLTKVTSLSSRGAFVKTGYTTPEQGELIELTITLLGHSAELDVCGRVVYLVSPCQQNNYVQGAGVCFEQPENASKSLINSYLSAALSKTFATGFLAKEQQGRQPFKAKTKKRHRIGIVNKAW